MGDTAPDFHEELVVPLSLRLQGAWDRVAWRPVYYAPVLQRNERAIFDRMRPLLRWEGLRELMLFGFSDAASLEHKKELAMSPYWQTQRLIVQQLDELFDELAGAAPLAIVAQSLGCQVMSNYIWDAQQSRAYAGIWSAPLEDGVPADSPRDRFRRMRSLQLLMTTGCNIPVFVAGHSARLAARAAQPAVRGARRRSCSQCERQHAARARQVAHAVQSHAVLEHGEGARPHSGRATRIVGVGLKPDLRGKNRRYHFPAFNRGIPCSSSTPTRSGR
jgi:hypothetical protein